MNECLDLTRNSRKRFSEDELSKRWLDIVWATTQLTRVPPRRLAHPAFGNQWERSTLPPYFQDREWRETSERGREFTDRRNRPLATFLRARICAQLRIAVISSTTCPRLLDVRASQLVQLVRQILAGDNIFEGN